MITRAFPFFAVFAILVPAVAESAPPVDHADYDRYCAWCHGEAGNGQGPSARRVDPVPRDFTNGVFRCRSTPSGSLPTDADLRNIILRGVPGTAMPGWTILTPDQIDNVIATVKSFSATWKGTAARTPISVPPETPATRESIARGAQVYEKMQCGQCHGKAGHGDGPASAQLHDDLGNSMHAADFTKSGMMKCGDSSARIYTTFMTGLSGSPMPSFDGQIQPQDAWDLVHYVESLRE